MKILFLGDLFVGGDLLSCSPHTKFVISEEYYSSDIRVANLEQVISNHAQSASKGIIHAPDKAIDYLKEFGIRYVCLAQNHIHDKFDMGIKDTIKYLDSVGIEFFGAGVDIKSASKPCHVSDDVYVIGACSYNGYPIDVKIASEDCPGVNPIEYKSLCNTIDALPINAKVILMLHWGKEYMRMPQYELISLAKKLLEHDKVKVVIGGHPHIVQGRLSHNKKKAYMSLGNFLFPNFILRDPQVVDYSSSSQKSIKTMTGFYKTKEPVYKIWNRSNRISIGVVFDTMTCRSRYIPFIQDFNNPIVRELHGLSKYMVMLWVSVMSILYTLPEFLYRFIERLNIYFVVIRERFKKRNFQKSQECIRESS